MHEVAFSSVRTHANAHASAHRPHASARPASDFEAMLETMADSAQLPAPTPTPAPGDAEAGCKPGAAAADAKEPATGGDMPVPLPAGARATPTPDTTNPETQGISAPAQVLPAPAAAAAGTLIQPAVDKPAKSSLANAKTQSEPATAEADAALALLQQAGEPVAAVAPHAPDGKQPAGPRNKEESTSEQSADAGDQPAANVAPSTSASVLQVVGEGYVPTTPLAAADAPSDVSVENTDQAAAITAALQRPALSAFEPAAPRAPSPSDAKPSKHADRSEPLAGTQTAEPEGILPPADKPGPAAAIEHKGDSAPALQHRSPAELLNAFSESRPSATEQLSRHAPFTDTSTTAAFATGSHPTIVSGAAATASTAQSLQPQTAVPLSGVPVLIASRALAGDKHIDIRLDPPDLGRIEVRLKVDREGQISSHLIADRPDTLALLRRDEAGLARAFQDAGFKTAGEGLQFSLRDQSGNGQPDARTTPQPLAADQDTNTRLDTVPSSYRRYSGRVGGLDIRV